MNSTLIIRNSTLTIECTKELEIFSYKFIDYYKENIDILKNDLGIENEINVAVTLTNNQKKINFVYGKSDFAGFFDNKGVFAYINLNSNKNEQYMFDALMHEIIHHIYKFYVYGKDKERITWVDEGLAVFFSGQKKELKDISLYNEFLKTNLIDSQNIDLNQLNHDDKSFNAKNGYNLSYIAIRYLYEIKCPEDFIDTVKNFNLLKEIGVSILHEAYDFYIINQKNILHKKII